MAEVSARGLTFHVQRLGKEVGRPTVVFLHGLVMDNLSSWYFAAATRVAQEAPVLLYDLRGHGRSERPEAGYGIADMVADLIAILDAEGQTAPVRLVGNSFGGLLALATAIAHPDRVAALALIDAHVSDESFGMDMANTLELEGEARDQVIAENFKDWLGRHSSRKRNRLARTAEALVYGTSLVSDLKASEPFSEAAMAAVSCPVLALYGEASDIVAQGRMLERLMPRCDLRIVAGCSHSVIWEATEAVRDALVSWAGES